MSDALTQLEADIRADLAKIAQPGAAWLEPKMGPDGRPALDVLIVGAGQSGVAIGFGLMRSRVGNIVLLDKAEEGMEGPWRTYARMPTLRSPKDYTGPDLDIPSLTYQSWHEARFGEASWQQLGLILREHWAEYLLWLRRTIGLPVRNGCELLEIAPAADGLLAARVKRADAIEVLYARKIVLATGQEGMGGWMIPPEADGQLMLLVQASDEDGTWSAGLVRAVEENLRPAGNRDGKRALNDRGRAAVRWLHARAPLQENVLIRLPDREVDAIFAAGSGQQRVNELFRRAQRMRVSRTVVATVAMQDDYMKRVRGGGGARDQLRAEGIVIFGDYAGDQVLAAALGLPRPGPGEFVSARLVPRPAEPGDRVYARSIRLAGADWLLAAAADPAAAAPALPR